MRTFLSVVFSLFLSVAPAVAAPVEKPDAPSRIAATIDSYVRNRGFNGVVMVANKKLKNLK